MAIPRAEDDDRVTNLELFFDLVFVFAITQVTGLMAHHPTWGGLAQGMLVLSALWFAWASYAWLTNTIDPEEGGVRLAIFAAMAALLVASLAVPEAFGDDAVVFGVAYLLVRILHIALYTLAGQGDRDLLAVTRRLAGPMLTGAVLILIAGFTDGALQYVLWIVAVALDLGGPLVRGVTGWRLNPHHFAERHGLIIIIALGESIVAVGVGPVAARRLAARTGVDRARNARDSYTYLHLPMVAGIVLFALGVKKTLEHVDEPLKIIPAVALCGGLSLYLLAHIAFRLRNVGSLNRQRLVTALVLAALIPVVHRVDALVGLTIVTVVCCGLIAYEAIRFRVARDRIRHPQPEVAVSS